MLARFASSLGVSTSDLGVSAQDRLLVAALSVLTGSIPLLSLGVWIGAIGPDNGLSFQESWREDLVRFVVAFPIVVVGFVVSQTLVGADAVSSQDWSGWTFVVAGLVAMWVGRTGVPFERHVVSAFKTRAGVVRWTVSGLAAAVAVVSVSLGASSDWADAMQEGETPRGPLQLGLVVQPSTGLVELADIPTALRPVSGSPDEAVCVVRVADGVYVLDGETMLLSGVEFRTDGCDPASDP